MNIREATEQNELSLLSKNACLSSNTKGREKPEEKCSLRTDFMRDRDRIIHSESFRRLKHKTQVFFSPANDLFRTRLTHTLEVSQISRTVARALKLNEDLTEAIALGHDIGHAPFGHTGERTLAVLNPEGFSHANQSFRIVCFIEKGGLNLTYEVKDGILHHSKGKGTIISADTDTLPQTLEGRIVRICDRIAYLNHDLDDALRANLLSFSDIPDFIKKSFGIKNSKRINTMVGALISSSFGKNDISLDDKTASLIDDFKDFMYKKVYNHPGLISEGEKTKKVIDDLFSFFYKNQDIVLSKMADVNYDKNVDIKQIISDYIAMMTDDFALMNYDKYILPRKWFSL
jgi:dGTPase